MAEKFEVRFINFLESYEAFKRLERDPADEFAYMDLMRIEGEEQAEWLYEFIIRESPVRCHPVMWHPGQAYWCFLHFPALRSPILDDAEMLGLRLEGFVPTACDVDPDLIESIAGFSLDKIVIK